MSLIELFVNKRVFFKFLLCVRKRKIERKEIWMVVFIFKSLFLVYVDVIRSWNRKYGGLFIGVYVEEVKVLGFRLS